MICNICGNYHNENRLCLFCGTQSKGEKENKIENTMRGENENSDKIIRTDELTRELLKNINGPFMLIATKA